MCSQAIFPAVLIGKRAIHLSSAVSAGEGAMLISRPRFSSGMTFPTLDISHPANQLWLALAPSCLHPSRISALRTSSVCVYALCLLLSNLPVLPASKGYLLAVNVIHNSVSHSASLLLLLSYHFWKFPRNLICYFDPWPGWKTMFCHSLPTWKQPKSTISDSDWFLRSHGVLFGRWNPWLVTSWRWGWFWTFLYQ